MVAIGRARGPERELFERYAGRFRPRLALSELPDGIGSPLEIRRREARSLLACVPAGAIVVALDGGGPTPSSEGFASLLRNWLEAGREIVFLLGGAEGLDSSVLERADHALSLGALTWPHLLARVMLAEQLYRARTILDGHPYHRGR